MATEFEASIDGVTPHGFGNTEATIIGALQTQFPPIFNTTAASTWADVSIVADATGDYIRTKGDIGTDCKKGFQVALTPRTTYYLRYSVYFESTGGSDHTPDDGYDWGDGNTNAKTWATAGKMPGLYYGDIVGGASGGSYSTTDWSGRLNFRGQAPGADGNAGLPRQSVTLSLYAYYQGSRSSYIFHNTHATPPYNSYDVPNHLVLETDVWYDVLLGYNAPDSADGWFKAWTRRHDQGQTWLPQAHLPNIRWMQSGYSGIDGFNFTYFHGGSDPQYFPDNTNYNRWKNFGVYTTEQEARDAFTTAGPQADFEVTSPAAGAVDVGTPITVSGTAPNDDDNDVIQYEIYNVTDTSTVTAYGADTVTYDSETQTWTADTAQTIPQGGETIRMTAQRWGP